MSDARPNPDELLARARREAGSGVASSALEEGRGRLKIFFGMAPGVGKTYAMLAAAQRMAAQGLDVVVGLVETHGRVETERQLLGLDILPRKRVEYRGEAGLRNGEVTEAAWGVGIGGGGGDAGERGVVLTEFDVEAAIGRRPDILLVDELAHSNAPGSARQKRWQDIRECLRAGISVYTTLNVQHLESLNDVVTQITGVAVRETVPDSVFDEADEVELVDLPADVLHERLRAGKVYLGESATKAVDPHDGFFRKGNLTALRELALRRTAAWVDSELRRYKQDRGIRSVWPAGERILVAVSPSPMSGKLVRAAKRMASGLHADLLAVYVETPRTADLPAADRERLTQNMRLAESLGATTTTLAGENAARELIAFARSRNVGKLVVGKTARARWREALFGSFISNLIRESGDIDIYVVRGDDGEGSGEGAGTAVKRAGTLQTSGGELTPQLGRAVAAVLVVAACTAIALVFYRPPELSSEALILLGGVVLSAMWWGRGPGMLASVLGVLALNFFFTEPRFSFSVSDAGYVFTFGVMLAVSLVVGSLAARTREQTRHAWERERRTAALYALSRELASAQDTRRVAFIAARHGQEMLAGGGADVIVAAPATGRAGGDHGRGLDVLASAGSPDWFDERERGVAQWSLDHGKAAGLATPKLPSSAARYVPLVGTAGKVGLLGIRPATGRAAGGGGESGFGAAEMLLLEAFGSQVASALERVRLSESEQAAKVDAERERLRSTLLSSVSHDLRTPLASITGAASTLEQSESAGGPSTSMDAGTRAGLLRTIIEESSRLSDIIANLVFATRLESGGVTLNKEWTTLEEVVGVGLSRHRGPLAGRPLRVQLPADLPMIRVDNAMLPQVIHNLLENALRYTPAGTPIAIGAWVSEGQVIVKVSDEGPGLAEDEGSKVFQRFYRGRASRSGGAAGGPGGTGMGLGLTICEGLIRAHGGRIWAEANVPRGVAFMFSLPVEQPQPTMPRELMGETGGRA